MPTNEKWTQERGYSIPPPAEGRNIVNEPMTHGPVRVGDNTLPTNKPKQKEPVESEPVKPVPTLNTTPKPLTQQQVKIEWQGCQFNVIFDDVWTQSDPDNPEIIKWLILVHDLDQHAGGPVWTPPVSTNDSELETITIYHNSTTYVCSYFGLDLRVPTCNLSLTTFLVVSQ